MLFSLIVPTLARKAELVRFLDSLDEQKVKFEAIVMDQNPPSFGLTEICAGRRGVRHVQSEVLGLSVNRNIALGMTTGDWVLFSDDDCVLDREFLVNAARELAGAPNEGIYFAEVRNLEDGEYYTFPLKDSERRIGYDNFKKIPSIGFVFSRQSLEALGGFDELLGIGAKYGSGEDTDILLRALGKGIPIRRLAGCRIFHPRMSHVPSLDRGRKYAMGYGALFAKHLLVQPWRRKPFIMATWLGILLRNTGGIILNFGNPEKFRYYLNSLAFKIRGHAGYLLHGGSKVGTR